jgi:O-antigen ligase
MAVLLPFFVFSLRSNDALRECKLSVQCLGAALVLWGLASERTGTQRVGRGVRVALLGLVVLLALSGSLAARTLDPFDFVPVLAAGALLLGGASRPGAAFARRLFAATMLAGVATGVLAVGQRFLGFWSPPVDVTQPRFAATALMGNPGHVGAALVLPSLLLWMRLWSGDVAFRRRLLFVAGLLAVLAGLGATETVTALAAVAAGLAIHLLLDFKRRWRIFLVGAVVASMAAGATGTLGRIGNKVRELRSGNLAAASTQRDIGLLAALEMIRGRPVFGVGPGGYESAFVPARLAAEERTRRRLVHLSESAHFENAHSEPFTLAAECGVPAALLAAGLVGLLVVALVKAARREQTAPPREDPPAEELLVLLAAFAVLSLGTFPLRLPAVVGPAAFVAGLAWRRVSETRPGPASRFWRLACVVFAVLVAAGAAVRVVAIVFQGRGERALFGASVSEEGTESRRDLLESARRDLRRSTALWPRRAVAWIPLASTYRLSGDLEAAWRSELRSFELGERAETDLNLGGLALRRGDADLARALFVRAAWILPRLRDLVPSPFDAEVDELLSRAQARLEKGEGGAPPVPERLARQRL